MPVDRSILRHWLEARSMARGLPPPVEDREGFRVDVCSNDEVCRWVFPNVCERLIELGLTLDEPRHLLKLCGTPAELRAALPERWRVSPSAYFMTADAAWPAVPDPPGYRFTVEREGCVVSVRAVDANGAYVAAVRTAETLHALVYDRIGTDPSHRRRGLGRAVMTRLHGLRRHPTLPQYLVATGEALRPYRSLGWRVMSEYATAEIPPEAA
jgi:GNAT superfamily N-acetyltransferase